MALDRAPRELAKLFVQVDALRDEVGALRDEVGAPGAGGRISGVRSRRRLRGRTRLRS